MWCSTASTTTIASSTTSPMASTSPNNGKRVDGEAQQGKTANVPINDTGTRDERDERGAPVLQEQEDTSVTSAHCFQDRTSPISLIPP